MPSVVVKSRSFYYEEIGEGDELLVFLSGLGGDNRAFGMIQRQLGRRYRTLALDSRDVGRSDRVDEHYTTADMADDVAGWLEQVGAAGAHVVGHSLGALVAQSLALRHPALVKSLVLTSSHAGSNAWRKAVIASWVLLRRQVPIGDFTRSTLPWLVAPMYYLHSTQIEGLVRFAEQNPWPQDPEAFARQARAAMEHDARGRLVRVRVPCLVLSGELDLVNPPRVAEELAREVPDSRLVILPDAGHMPHIEQKGPFRDAIQTFLEHVSG